jgi:tetratricopeptide (TPR) repeat protein
MTVRGLAGTLLLAGAVGGARAATPPASLQAADAAYAAWDDARALAGYLELLQGDPTHYEALWKASRAHVDLGDLVPGGAADARERQLRHYTAAVELAERACAARPDDVWGHFQLAAATGKRILLLSKQEQIDAARTIRAAIDRALAIAPDNPYALHALGRWHRRMAEIGGVKRLVGGLLYGSIPKGSLDASEQALRRAVAGHPAYAGHHLELGRTLAARGKRQEARAAFRQCIALPKISSKGDLIRGEAQAELDALAGAD